MSLLERVGARVRPRQPYRNLLPVVTRHAHPGGGSRPSWSSPMPERAWLLYEDGFHPSGYIPRARKTEMARVTLFVVLFTAPRDQQRVQ